MKQFLQISVIEAMEMSFLAFRTMCTCGFQKEVHFAWSNDSYRVYVHLNACQFSQNKLGVNIGCEQKTSRAFK